MIAYLNMNGEKTKITRLDCSNNTKCCIIKEFE